MNRQENDLLLNQKCLGDKMFRNSKNSKKVNVFHKNYINWNDRYSLIEQIVHKYAKGKTLDIGCGKMPYKDFFNSADEYIGVDISPIPDQEMIVSNAIDLPFKDNSFDTVVSFEVLEHIPNPFKVFNEISRVLKPKGTLILTTPQMWNLHEEPNDYYRFTKYGLAYLCDKSNFKVIFYKPLGCFWGRVGLKISYKLEGLVQSKFLIISFVGKMFRLINNVVFRFISLKWPTPNDATGNLIVARNG